MADFDSILNPVTGLVDKVGSFSFGGGGANPAFFSKGIMILKAMGMLALVVGIVLFIWKFYMQYKVRVRVHIKSAGNITEIVDDMAKEVRDEQGKIKLILYKLRKGRFPYTCPVPESCYKFKKGKHDFYYLSLDDNRQLHPIEITIKQRIMAKFNKVEKQKLDELEKKQAELVNEASKALKPIEQEEIEKKDLVYMKIRPQERDAWARYEDKALEEKFKKKSWLDQYMPLIVITTLSVTVILVFYFLFKEIGGGMTSIASSFNNVANNCLR